MSKYRPVSPRMQRLFEKHGCRFVTRWYSLNGEMQEHPCHVEGQTFEMRDIRAKDGSYIGDAKDGRHLRWLARHGIYEPMRAKEGDNTASIGRATKGPHAGKWVGWSHRAACAFGIGSTVKQGDCAFNPSCQEEMIEDLRRWYEADNHRNISITRGGGSGPDPVDGLLITYEFQFLGGPRKGEWETKSTHEPFPDKWGRGEWTAMTDDDAKQMAIDFAESVS